MFTGKKKAACAAMLSMAMVAPLAAFAENETRVITCGTLNLRAAPSPAGTVIANLPNGAEVTVYGEWNGWYVVQYGDQVGYAAAAYIDV